MCAVGGRRGEREDVWRDGDGSRQVRHTVRLCASDATRETRDVPADLADMRFPTGAYHRAGAAIIGQY